MLKVFQQVLLLTSKNVTVARRRPLGSLARLLTPVLIIALYMSLQSSSASSAFNVPDPVSPGGGIPPCRDYLGGDDCVTVRYDTNGGDAGIAALMTRVQELSGLPEKDFVPLDTDQENNVRDMAQLIFDTANQTSSVVVFHDAIDWTGDGGGQVPLPFTTYVNVTTFTDSFQATPDGLTEQKGNIYYHVSETIWRAQMELELGLTAGTLEIEPTYVSLPPLASRSGTEAARNFDIQYGLLYLLAPITILFHAPLMDMVNERTKKLHQGLVVMGLKQSAYIVSWLLYYSLWGVATTAVVLIMGAIAGSIWIEMVEMPVRVAIYGGYALGTLGFGIFMGSILHGSRGGIGCASLYYTTFAFVAFIAGTLSWGDLLWASFWDPNARWGTGRVIVAFLQFTPFWQVAQIWSDVARVTGASAGGFLNFNFEDVDPRDYTWDDLSVRQNKTTIEFINGVPTASTFLLPSPGFHLALIYTMFFLYSCLAWLCYHVRPGQYGAASNPLSPRFWGFSPSLNDVYTFPHEWKRAPSGADPDVSAIVDSTFSPSHASKQGLVVAGLTKRFGSHAAVDSLSFNAPRTGCVSVLGHNGAGKTTTINLILGLHSITSGNAVICGQSSKHNVNGVRDLIGVCPQHDILWDELTARETLTMFARLKGLFSNTNAEVEKALAAVRLTTVGDQFVSSYSGGMKRRLSVALATLGSPKAVFLDEPTAGLDPLNKRHIWELVQTLKKDRLVILTSHSMMEADALSDIVAVMAGGQLKAFGPSLKLKERYGLGYHIDIVTKAGNEKAAIDLVRKHMGNAARLDASNAGNLNFSVPSDAVEKLSGFLTILEAESGKNRSLISDFGVSHTTLEEVFLNITSGSAAAKAQAEARAAARAMRANSRSHIAPPAYSGNNSAAPPQASFKGASSGRSGSRRRAPDGSSKGSTGSKRGSRGSSKRMSSGSNRAGSSGSKRGSSKRGSLRAQPSEKYASKGSTGSKRGGSSKRDSKRGSSKRGGSTGSKRRQGGDGAVGGAYASQASNTSL